MDPPKFPSTLSLTTLIRMLIKNFTPVLGNSVFTEFKAPNKFLPIDENDATILIHEFIDQLINFS